MSLFVILPCLAVFFSYVVRIKPLTKRRERNIDNVFHLFIYLFIYFVYLSIYLFIYLFVILPCPAVFLTFSESKPLTKRNRRNINNIVKHVDDYCI